MNLTVQVGTLAVASAIPRKGMASAT